MAHVKPKLWGPLLAVSVALLGLYAGLASHAQSVSSSSLNVPQPAAVIPSSEMVGGSVGASTDYMRADARLPRITRAVTVTTDSGGTFSGTWSTPFAVAPTIVMTPIAASTSIDCQLTAPPTASGFQGRCWSAQTTLLNLSIITAGISLNPVTNTAAGVQIQVIGIPPTQ